MYAYVCFMPHRQTDFYFCLLRQWSCIMYVLHFVPFCDKCLILQWKKLVTEYFTKSISHKCSYNLSIRQFCADFCLSITVLRRLLSDWLWGTLIRWPGACISTIHAIVATMYSTVSLLLLQANIFVFTFLLIWVATV